ncbi:ABC transporter substrate-binding protein [Desulforhopalus sp. IMCC35007]|uniref:substrate-binding periplasmic protein n=1 Tax=Desulforhopalus sp. IMCC35007 TaxID=2569543 RepID=UPI00197AB60D|nr:transporter substrate-binding domain-containing protein [Desulforhopalus sp. IMCC35007]
MKIATLEDYAPYCLTVEGYETDGIFPPNSDSMGLRGYSWDVVRESFHEMGYTIDLTVSPWARAMLYLKNGQTDLLFPTGKNTQRQKTFYYSQEPVNHADFLIYVLKDSPIEWNGLESLKGLKIGLKRGFNYGDKWAAAANIIKLDIGTISNGFKMLDLRRIDGFVGYEINWDYFLQKAGWETKYRKLPVFDSTMEHVVALKSNPRALELLNSFDAGKRKIIQNGTLQKIKEKWLGNKPE